METGLATHPYLGLIFLAGRIKSLHTNFHVSASLSKKDLIKKNYFVFYIIFPSIMNNAMYVPIWFFYEKLSWTLNRPTYIQ